MCVCIVFARVCVCGVGSSYLYHTLIYHSNNPKAKSSDDGSASKPKRSCDVLSISEKVKILDMIGIEKKSCGDCHVYGKNESSIREVMKNKEKNRTGFSGAPQTAKIIAIAPDKVLNEGGKIP